MLLGQDLLLDGEGTVFGRTGADGVSQLLLVGGGSGVDRAVVAVHCEIQFL